MLDLAAGRDDDVGDVLRREQAVVDDAGLGVEAAGQLGRILDRPVQSAMTPPSGLGGPPRGTAGPSRRSVAAKAEREQLERDRRPDALDPLLGRGDDDEAVGRRGDDLLARVRPPPPLTSHGPGAIWSAPSIAMSSSASASIARLFLIAGDPDRARAWLDTCLEVTAELI